MTGGTPSLLTLELGKDEPFQLIARDPRPQPGSWLKEIGYPNAAEQADAARRQRRGALARNHEIVCSVDICPNAPVVGKRVDEGGSYPPTHSARGI